MEQWAGKTAVVTGASGGIGAATVVALAQHNVNVVGLDCRMEQLQALTEENKHLPGKITPLECDVMKPDSITAAFNHIEKHFGGVDILVNNAGTRRNGGILDLSKPDENYTLAIDTNLTGMLLCTRRAFNTMKMKNLGYIINLNSVVGHMTPQPSMAIKGSNIYGATKHAVKTFTEMVRLELAVADNKNIRVTSLSPGTVATGFAEASGANPIIYKENPSLQAEDVADAIILLLSTKPGVNITELTIQPTGEKL